MRSIGSLVLVSLLAMQTACSEDSVAAKYLSSAPAADETSSGGTTNTGGSTSTSGDATAGQALVTSKSCSSCHAGMSGQTVLDKTAIEKLDAAADQGLHSSFKAIFTAGSTDRANLEAYLNTK